MNRSEGLARTRLCLLASLAGCANGGLEVAPGELEARDLLGLDPALAIRWNDEERAAARRVFDRALALPPVDESTVSVPASARRRELARALDRADVAVFSRGEPARLVWRISAGIAEPLGAAGLPPAPGDGPAIGALRPSGWELGERAGWGQLAARQPSTLVSLAQRAGREAGGTLVVEPVAQTSFAVAYLADSDRLLVNPVLLAALEPELGGGDVVILPALTAAEAQAQAAPASRSARAGGNPYNFYGSLSECAAAEQIRCNGCLPANDCEITTIDGTDGASECQSFAAEAGRGYFLICANTAMAIATVGDCLADAAGACPRNEDVGRSVLQLEANAALVDDATCRAALDGCLAELYGEPDGEFPPPPADAGPGQPDGGGVIVPPPSRDVNVDCTSCESDNSCNFEPDCSGSCVGCSDKSSSGGSDEDGCGDSCNGCSGNSCEVGCTESDNSSGEDSSSGCNSCESSDDSGSSSDSSCDCSSDSEGDSGSSCGDCGSDGSCGDCGSCGSSDSDSMSSSNSCGNCQVAPRRRGPQRQALLSTLWGLLPLVVMGVWRRRTRRAGGAS